MAGACSTAIQSGGSFATLVSAVCDLSRYTKETVFDVCVGSPSGEVVIEVPAKTFSSRRKFAAVVFERCGWPLKPEAEGVAWASEISEALQQGKKAR